MSPELQIQPLASAQEASECADLMVRSEPWITLRLPRESALAVVTDRAKEVHAARDAAGVSGFIVLDMRGLLTGYIQILCVRPDRRGEGLGTQLIQWAEDRIFRDSPNVFICVSSFNASARRLYERLAFQPVGRLSELLVPGHDELLLRKTRGTWSDFRGMKSAQPAPHPPAPAGEFGDSTGGERRRG
jgi:ribosomal-protein-alanine N-acetyltransferase